MAIIIEQIEPLKKIRDRLNYHGIDRFSSVADINQFLNNAYENEKREIAHIVQKHFQTEKLQLEKDLAQTQKNLEFLETEYTQEINAKVEDLELQIQQLSDSKNKYFWNIFFKPLKLKSLRKRKLTLQIGFGARLDEKTRNIKQEVSTLNSRLQNYLDKSDHIIQERILEKSQQLDEIKDILEDLYPLIAGAIGENDVVTEMKKLSDEFHIFNDFSLSFHPPIYNRKENDKIFSIQIDHLVVCRAGIFILETKNWSKKSVANIDLRSPIHQIQRSSYALFVFLNSHSQNYSMGLNNHHWGCKQIPIRNLVVMTNYKPKEQFKNVKILSLKKLNGYLQYFEPVFTNEEVLNISSYLKDEME